MKEAQATKAEPVQLFQTVNSVDVLPFQENGGSPLI